MNDQSNTTPVPGRLGLAMQRGSSNADTAYVGNGRQVTTMLIPAGISVVPITTRRVSRRLPHRAHPHHFHRLRVGTSIPLPLVRKPDPDTQSITSGVMCRICFSGEEAGKLGKFCQCAGTIEFCHHHCLTRWIQQSNMETCELCGYSYRMQQRPICIWRWRCPPFQPLQQFFFCIYVVAWIALLGSAGWLLFVTFGFDPMYRDSELAPLIYGLYGLIGLAALGIIFFESIFVVRPFCNTLLRYNRETVVLPYNQRTSQTESGSIAAEAPRRYPANIRTNFQQMSTQTNMEALRRLQRISASDGGRNSHRPCLSQDVRYLAVSPHHIPQPATHKMERLAAKPDPSVEWPVMVQNGSMLQEDEDEQFLNPYDRNATILNFARPVKNLHVAPIANQHVYCHVYAQNSSRNKIRPDIDRPLEFIQPMPSSSSSCFSCTASTSTNDAVSYSSISQHGFSRNSLQINEFSPQWLDRWMPVICSSSELGTHVASMQPVKANYISMPSIDDSTSNLDVFLPYLATMDLSSSEEQINQLRNKEQVAVQQTQSSSTGKSLLHKCVQSSLVKTSLITTPDINGAEAGISHAILATPSNSASLPKLRRMYHSDTSLALASPPLMLMPSKGETNLINKNVE